MNDTALTVLGLASLVLSGALIHFAPRIAMAATRALLAHRRRPFKVVGHSFDLGMVAVRWRDDPDRTHWLTPARLAQQKGLHR